MKIKLFLFSSGGGGGRNGEDPPWDPSDCLWAVGR